MVHRSGGERMPRYSAAQIMPLRVAFGVFSTAVEAVWRQSSKAISSMLPLNVPIGHGTASHHL